MSGSAAFEAAAVSPPWADAAWLRTVALLNLASLASQIGQFGIGFAVVPLWMSSRGAAPTDIGLTTSMLWFGMLGGLLATPALLRRMAPRTLVIAGVGASAAAAVLLAAMSMHDWLAPAFAFGFGQGMRWIANESWLYSLCPPGAKGRIVGIHETLIGAAAFVGPAVLTLTGVRSVAPFAAAAGFSLLAALPVLFARLGNRPLGSVRTPAPLPPGAAPAPLRALRWMLPFVALGPLVAGLGGLIENAWYALLPVYTTDGGYDARQGAWLLTAFGCGGMALQYPIGVWTDRIGVRRCAAACSLALALTGLLVGLLALPGWALAAALLLMGGLTSAYLTLGTIAATDARDPGELARRVACTSIAFTLLSALGPLLSGAVARVHGGGALPWLVAALAGALAAGLWFGTREALAPATRNA